MKTSRVRVAELTGGLAIASIMALCGTAHGQVEGLFGVRQGAQVAPPRIPFSLAEPPPIVGGENEIRLAPMIACFAQGTDPRYVALVNQQVAQINQGLAAQDYFLAGGWGPAGRPVTLRWSFVPDGTQWPNLNNVNGASALFSTFDSGFASQGGRATWTNRFVQSFARWSQLTGNVYVRITLAGVDWDDGAAWGAGGAAGVRGDVRIGARPLDGGNGVLAFNTFPTGGDMSLDTNDIGNFASSASQNLFLRDVIMHEHGHGLGLQHVCSNNSAQLMAPFINTGIDGPRQDDIRGIQALYGDPFAPNSSAGTARVLSTTVGPGTSLSYGTIPAPLTNVNDPNASLISIDPSNPTDWYSITTTAGVALTVTVTPVGSTYQNAAQTASGCPGGTTPAEDALRNADLFIRVTNSNGSVVLAQNTTAGLGTAKTLSNAILSTPGTYLIQVGPLATPTFSEVQAYRMSIVATTTTVAPTFVEQPAGGSFCSGDSLTLTATVTGLPAPTFQWRKDGVNIVGATSQSLNLGTLDPSEQGSYVLVATNSVATVNSNPAVVTVNTPPVITQEPQDVTVPVGGSATFTVATTGTVNQYQWSANAVPIPGATGPSLTINPVTLDDEGFYQVAIVGPCGSLFSQFANLTIGQPQTCYPNCDGSTTAPILNALDFACFLNRYIASDPYANCDGSTIFPTLNALDFACFLTAFRNGCP